MTEDLKNIREAVEARVKAEADTQTEQADDGITPEFVRECFAANRLGDGTLFAALNKGRFVCNMTAKDEWLRWGGHYWEMDVSNRRFSEGVEAVVAEYFKEVDRLNESIEKAGKDNEGLAARLTKRRNAYLGRIKSLRDTGADKCLLWGTRAAGGLTIEGEQLDRDPWLLACKNGVIELRTGRFRPGRPEDYITKYAPHVWAGIDTPAPRFESFLDAIFEGNAELIGFVQRFFGYGVTGVTTTHAFGILYGEGGRNGKSTLVETLHYVLGPLAGPIQAELLLDQKVPTSANAPSPGTMSLKALRIAFASETDEGRRFSVGRIKVFTGGDKHVARNPNDKYMTRFEPTHLLCLLTNNLPHAPSEDLAFWDRLHLIPFNVRFVLDPKDPNERPRVEGLVEELKREAPGIIAWLVRGCLEWQRQGLNPPDIVKSATGAYQFREDDLANFISECCETVDQVSADCREQFKIVYNAFAHWYGQMVGDKKFCPRKKKFGELMQKRFRKDTSGGRVWFYGISIKPEARATGDNTGWTEE